MSSRAKAMHVLDHPCVDVWDADVVTKPALEFVHRED